MYRMLVNAQRNCVKAMRRFSGKGSVTEPLKGLVVVENFFAPAEVESLLRRAAGMMDRLEVAEASARKEKIQAVVGSSKGGIASAADLTSENASLAKAHTFVRLKVLDENQAVRNCEYFGHYYEPGHELAYFRHNPNIPLFAWDFATRLVQFSADASNPNQTMRDLCAPELPTVSHGPLTAQQAKRTWKLTANRYTPLHDAPSPTFPYHVDLPANGLATFLLSLSGRATFEIKPVPEKAGGAGAKYQDVPYELINGTMHNLEAASLPAEAEPVSLEVLPGTLVVLADEARWKYMHRVVTHSDRIAIVLGAQ